MMKEFLKSLFAERCFRAPSNAMPRRLSILDVGARGGAQWPWNGVSSELLEVILVEPDPEEAEKLQRQFDGERAGMVLPVALWRDDRTLTLNLNRSPGTSSVYAANKCFLDQFPEAARFDVLETIALPAQTIDSLVSAGTMPAIDFAKVDVQGAELAVLQGGLVHLRKNLIGLEVEVEFAPIYSEQPLFGEVDTFVREKLGLELWDLRKTYWKYEQGAKTPGPTKGRLIFGDALYFRPLSNMDVWLEAMPLERAKEKAACLVLGALIYGYADYATAVLEARLLSKYVEQPTREALQHLVKTSGAGFRPLRNGSGALHALLDAIARAFKPTYGGWATGGNGLGSRRRGPFWC